jgi:hypothetical protein
MEAAMGPAFYILAILGCGDGGTACEQVRVEHSRFVSADACAAARPEALIASSDVDFPMVIAECRTVNAVRAASSVLPADR